MTINYNSKRKMIRIEQYNQDPQRVGHELIVSLPTQRRIRSTQTLKPKKPKQSSFQQTMLEFQRNMLEFQRTMLEFRQDMLGFQQTVLEFIKEQKVFNARIETTLVEQGEAIGRLNQKLDTVIKLNNLKTE